ncbi:hypothetical protein SAMN02927900_05763 [Rhizobium mongolense subsp. loessense]|uniref:Uncharacterized protein n=1 Tax=Rhizobium mongolense subsp. loessense TaxID=158890 RepID=A0A1G4TZ91_9HYPH|nr:hypothetical protein SAMN02927900_05763 [Rhizobium mongolense subsp. loessense]
METWWHPPFRRASNELNFLSKSGGPKYGAFTKLGDRREIHFAREALVRFRICMTRSWPAILKVEIIVR